MREHRIQGLVGVCLGLMALCVMGPVAGAAAGESTIRPGDRLRVDVLNRPEYSVQEAVVREDGVLSYFLVGEVAAAGLTVEELRHRIQEGLRPHISNAEVIVSPVPKENQVFVGGQVTKPGRYPFEGDALSIEAAIILAGGLLPDSADARSVYHLQTGGTPIPHDLTLPFETVVSVRPRDIVYVPERTRVYVTGNVVTAGVYYFDGAISVGEALARAGGALDDQGDLGRVVVVHPNGVNESVDAGEMFWAETDGTQPKIRHGDTVYVPNVYKVEEISVLGHVHAPGVHRVRGPVTIGRALALAGGAIVEEANMRKLRVSRLDGSMVVVDYEDQKDVHVYPGETLRVTERFRVNWSLMVSFVSTATVLVSLFR